MWDAAGNFVYRTLGVPEDELPQSCVETVRRLTSPRRSGPVRDEVLVVFTTSASRDLVARHSPNLSNKRNQEGKPTAGVRMQIPDHLNSLFKKLERHGHALRAKHGDGLKRHIKFDDDERSLFLGVRLPGEEKWTKLSAEFVRGIMKEEEHAECESRRHQFSARPQAQASREQIAGPGTSSRGGPPQSTTLLKYGNKNRRTWSPKQ